MFLITAAVASERDLLIGLCFVLQESQRQVSESTQASQHCVDQVDHGGPAVLAS